MRLTVFVRKVLETGCDPFGRVVQLAHLGVQRGDVAIEDCCRAEVAGPFGGMNGIQEALQSGLVLVQSELTAADVSSGACG